MSQYRVDERGAAPVIAVLLLVALVVVLVMTVSTFVLTNQSDIPPPAPQIGVSHSLVPDGNEETIAVTLEGGESVATDRLYVIGSKPLDIGGAPGSGTPANEAYASDRENFVEASGSNPPQVGIGDEWEAGEAIYLDPEGSADDVTVKIYWNTEPVQGVNPGTVEGDDAYLIAEFRV